MEFFWQIENYFCDDWHEIFLGGQWNVSWNIECKDNVERRDNRKQCKCGGKRLSNYLNNIDKLKIRDYNLDITLCLNQACKKAVKKPVVFPLLRADNRQLKKQRTKERGLWATEIFTGI